MRAKASSAHWRGARPTCRVEHRFTNRRLFRAPRLAPPGGSDRESMQVSFEAGPTDQGQLPVPFPLMSTVPTQPLATSWSARFVA
jgi:hypothetical protein